MSTLQQRTGLAPKLLQHWTLLRRVRRISYPASSGNNISACAAALAEAFTWASDRSRLPRSFLSETAFNELECPRLNLWNGNAGFTP